MLTRKLVGELAESAIEPLKQISVQATSRLSSDLGADPPPVSEEVRMEWAGRVAEAATKLEDLMEVLSPEKPAAAAPKQDPPTSPKKKKGMSAKPDAK